MNTKHVAVVECFVVAVECFVVAVESLPQQQQNNTAKITSFKSTDVISPFDSSTKLEL